MNLRSLAFGMAALLALAFQSGCGNDSPSLSSEMDDVNYHEGQEMKRQGRWDEALAAYLKVIDRRGDAAPESNLEAGLIYLYHIKDPIYAIYHFRKYLELEPNSKQAVYVRGLIDASKRDFARALPGQPLESQTERLGMQEQVELLQRENDELRTENAALRAGTPVAPTHSSTIDLSAIPTPQTLADTAPTPDPSQSPISLAPIGGDDATPDQAATVPAQPAAPEPRPSKAAASGAARHHVVVKGDTLFNLAQKYYGNRSRWRDIVAANRGVLSGENAPLKIGMDLKIP